MSLVYPSFTWMLSADVVARDRPFRSGAHRKRTASWLKFALRAGRHRSVSAPPPVVALDAIKLGGGNAFPDLLPDVSVEAADAATLFRTEALQYGPLYGLPELRQEVVRFLKEDGVTAKVDSILILNGAKQALDLLLRTLVDKGDAVVVSRPTYLSALSIIRNHEASIIEIDRDEGGMKVDELDAKLRRLRAEGGKLPKLLFEVPDFHNPTGITLSEERRRTLVRLAEEFDFFILEDDPYRRLRFSGEAVAPIKSFDTNGRVIGAGTFSKILAPGIRVGWANGDPAIIGRMAALKSEGGCCPLTQRIVLDLLRSGRIAHHIAELTPVMKRHRDAMTDAFRVHLPEARFRAPDGGYFLWVELPDGIDANAVTLEAERDGVIVFPGQLSFASAPPANFIRLAFSYCGPDEIERGVRKLCAVVRRQQMEVSAQPGQAEGLSLAGRHYD